MTLDQLVTHAAAHVSRPRAASLKSLAKHYAAMLGTDPAHCHPDAYQLPSDERNALIDLRHPLHWQPNTLRNCKTGIAWLLAFGERQGYLTPLEEFLSWRSRRRIRPW